MDAEGTAGAGQPGPDDDRAAVAELVRVFFAAFVSGDETAGGEMTGGDAAGGDAARRLDRLRDVLLPQALIIRAGAPEPAVYDVDGFLAPRRELLASGRLTGFREWAVDGRTDVFGDIAQHSCRYAKEGVRDGAPFTGGGHKTFQFVRTPDGWRIGSVAWHDE